MVDVPPNIHRILLPMLSNATGHVNCYLLRDSDGGALVDCGWNTPETLETLLGAMRGLGVEPEEIHTLIVTHSHPDHYGLAGTLVKRGKPRLLMPRLEWEFVSNHLADQNAARQELLAWLERNGLDIQGRSEEEKRAIQGGVHSFTPVPPDVALEDGDRISIGDRTFQVLSTPGHSVGHICLYDAERRLLFSGDHVMDVVTPHISTPRPLEGDLLGTCLESLRKVAALEVDLVLPGHGAPFTGLQRRVNELLAHHARREGEVLEILARGPATGAEVARLIPWSRRALVFDNLPPNRQRAALGQTLAHLEKLRASGQVVRARQNGQVLYERAAESGV